MKRKKIVDEYVCDCCGAEIENSYAALQRNYSERSNADKPSISVSVNGHIAFEWWAAGDYCEKCGELLTDSVLASIRVPERYDAEFRDRDGRIRGEIEVINERRTDS